MLNPETITVIDPACGSGHILVEAYEVLKAIYLERGYQLRSIPRLILEKNLYGLDIDDRAAQLAGFALLMKARADDRRLFDELPKLNVYSIQSSKNLNLPLLWRQLDLNGQGKIGTTSSLFDEPQTDLVQVVDDSNYQLIKNTLALFEQAQTLGSLIQVPAEHAEPLKDLLAQLQALTTEGNNFQKIAATTLIPFIRQAVILGMQFDAVVANPPYMGGKGMNPALKEFAKREFPDSKSDLFAMFMERGFQWCKPSGFNAMVTMQSWMFLSSFQAMREKLLNKRTLSCMVHMGNGVMGIAFGTAATIFLNQHINDYAGGFSYCENDNLNENGIPAQFPVQNERLKTAKPDDFKKIPGSPVAYWISQAIVAIFANSRQLKEISMPRQGNTTTNNAKFVRGWYEVAFPKIGFQFDNASNFLESAKKWCPYNKGGGSIKWYGLNESLINWENNGAEIKSIPHSVIANAGDYFKPGITFSTVSSSGFGFRSFENGFIFDNKGASIFVDGEQKHFLIALLNSAIFSATIHKISPTVSLQPGDVAKMPVLNCSDFELKLIVNNSIQAIHISKYDWDSFEESWDFTSHPLITFRLITSSSVVGWVSDSVTQHTEATDVGLRDKAANPTYASVQSNTELPSVALDSGIPAGMTVFEDNGIVPTLQSGNAGSDAPASRNAGALPDEFPRRSVGTINASTNLEQCFNRWQMQNRAAILEMQRLEKENNRLFIEAYGLQDELSPEVPEAQITLARADREKDSQRLISYAIGCMMGRYRLDKPGLIYAHAGNVDFDKIYYGTDTPPFEKGGPGGILHITQAESEEQNQEQIPPNPPFTKGGIFAPDADGIVPITDELWFEDDAANRLNEFLLAVWDAETLEENKSWLAESLGQKGNETPQQTIRRYIAGSFYKNHLQTYKKRPIYWLFSSGKQGAFQALVYLHRYNESTLARMRAEYVVPLTGKIQSRIEMLKKDAAVASSNAEKSKLDKDIDKLGKKYVELLSFDEKLRHYADLRILLDLDDGVKVNYGKFGDLLAEVKSVTGGTGND